MAVIENLEQYRQRTLGFMRDSLPHDGTFETNPRLKYKVDSQGKFLPFYGDTVIYHVDSHVKAQVKALQDILYSQCKDMLAEAIDCSTFHVTLHDLNNGERSPWLAEQMEGNRRAVGELWTKIGKGKGLPIRVRTVSVFNMVNTSVVLGLEPADEESCRRLMELYEQFQKVVFLGYPLTLHITVAYFRPGVYSDGQRQALAQAFSEANRCIDMEFCLTDENLVYQCFSDMNHYGEEQEYQKI